MDLKKLLVLGLEMTNDLLSTDSEKNEGIRIEAEETSGYTKKSFTANYQMWYTEAHAVLRQLLPFRLEEFEYLYKGRGDDKQLVYSNFTIQEWLMGVRSNVDSFGQKRFEDCTAIASRFSSQLLILGSVQSRFESSLFDIRQIVQADLFDSELDASKELGKHGYLRAAGVIAGVVLERHLVQVSINHSITLMKKDPTISDLNDALKNGSALDIPGWRNIQRLADIRNLCGHNKDREPTKDEVNELIDGVDKIVKTLF